MRNVQKKHRKFLSGDEERTREREKDLRRQGEALAATMASHWDEALRRCAMVPAGAPYVQSAPVGVSGAFQSFPPVPPPGGGRADCCWKKAHQIAGGLAGPPLQRHGLHLG